MPLVLDGFASCPFAMYRRRVEKAEYPRFREQTQFRICVMIILANLHHVVLVRRICCSPASPISAMRTSIYTKQSSAVASTALPCSRVLALLAAADRTIQYAIASTICIIGDLDPTHSAGPSYKHLIDILNLLFQIPNTDGEWSRCGQEAFSGKMELVWLWRASSEVRRSVADHISGTQPSCVDVGLVPLASSLPHTINLLNIQHSICEGLRDALPSSAYSF